MSTIIFAAVVIGSILAILVTLNQLSHRIEEANQALRNISKHLGVHDALLESMEEELKELVEQGEQIEAIRLYREKTGLGVKEAHDHFQDLGLETSDDEELSDEN